MIRPNDPILIASINEHEGLSLKPYQDSRGVWTIGYGTNITQISLHEAEMLRDSRLTEAHEAASEYDWWLNLTNARQRVVVEMIYQLGQHGFDGFVKMQGALSRGDYEHAAYEMLDSQWRKQVPERARILAGRMRRG